MELLYIILSIVVSYLLGSINSAIIVSRALYKEDIRTHGSGNAGLTNILRTYGAKAAALTLIGDMLKGVLAIIFTSLFFGLSYSKGISTSPYCYLSGAFAVLGHVFPVFYGFKGGKGVLVTATMALVLCPLHFFVLLTVFAVIVVFSRYVSLGSIVVAALFPITVCLYIPLVLGIKLPIIIAAATFFLGGFVIWCHRSNIKRLLAGNEKKISIGGEKKHG
jgi:glycerol-3-phosphate acyltransferase PlsY